MSALRRNVRLLQWFNFFEDFRPYAAFIVLYFVQVTGSYALGMTVLSVMMLSSSVFEVPTGVVSDRVGRVRTMTLGCVADTICMFLWASGNSVWMLCLGAVFGGLGMALFSGNNVAFLHDTLKQEGREEEYSHFLGRTSALFQAGLGASALVGGFVASSSLRYVMWLGVLPPLVCLLLSMCMIEPRIHTDEVPVNVFQHLGTALRRFRDNARLRSLSLVSMLDYGFGQSQWTFLPVFFASLWPAWAVGLARAFSHAAAFISFWFAGAFLRRFEPLKTLVMGMSVIHLLAIVGYAARSIFSPLILSSFSIFFGVKTVAEGMLLQREFSDRERATMGSLNQFGGNIVYAVASVGIGMVADAAGSTKALIASELILFAGLLLYKRAFRSA